jgi:hypothetical protein
MFAVFSLVFACQPSDEGEGETIAATESNGDGDGDPGDGDGDGEPVCFSVTDPAPGEVPDCELPQPCPEVDFITGDCELGDPTYDPAPAICVVEALAAGTQAFHSISDCDGGVITESWRLQVLGDGTVVYSNNRFEDLVSDRRATWRAMPDAAYFNACQTDTAAQFIDCIQGIAQQECQLGVPSCP